MKLRYVVIPAVLFIGVEILANLVSDDVGDLLSSLLGPNYRPVVYIGLGTLVVLLYVINNLIDRFRSKPELQSEQFRGDFATIWPAFAETLVEDLRRSEASAELARRCAKDRTNHQGIEIYGPTVRTEFTKYHQRTLSKFDRELGDLLKRYISASRELQVAANTYNQISYADGREGPDFPFTDRLEKRSDYQAAKEDMYQRSRALEDAIDLLQLKVRYYQDIYPT